MDDFANRKKMDRIELLKDDFSRYKKIANGALEKLYIEFNKQNLNTEKIDNNELRFECLGLKFISRPEVSFNPNTQRFGNGKISSYIISKENKEELILEYEFDSIGNINGRFLENEFSIHYYADLFINHLNYSVENDLKFKIE